MTGRRRPPRLRLIPQWRERWWRLWSIRILLLALIVDGMDAYFSVFEDAMPAWWHFGIGIALKVAAGVSRLIYQPSLRRRR
jgi:membrane protein YdbS with pleckstrin-like domain